MRGTSAVSARHRPLAVSPGARRCARGGGIVSDADSNPAVHGGLGIVVGALVGWFLASGSFIGVLMGAVIGAALGITLLGSQGEERKRVDALFIVVFFVIFSGQRTSKPAAR